MARRGNTTIILNVYDLNPTNEYLYSWGLGTYHSGVQIGSEEYSFASGAGIFSTSPKQEQGQAKFRESINMGNFQGDIRQIESVISTMRTEFSGNAYNLITKNCNSFSQALVKRLLNRDIPGYVNRMADIGSYFTCLLPSSMTDQSPVGNTLNNSTVGGGGYPEQQRLLEPFSGTGFKLGSTSGTASGNNSTREQIVNTGVGGSDTGLNDRRERLRQAALSRLQAESSSVSGGGGGAGGSK